MLVFIVNDFWRGLSIVGAMLFHFRIGGKEGVMKDWVDSPSLWQLEVRVSRVCGDDFEWSVTFRGEFGLRVCGLDIGSFQLDLLSNGRLSQGGGRSFCFHDLSCYL